MREGGGGAIGMDWTDSKKCDKGENQQREGR